MQSILHFPAVFAKKWMQKSHNPEKKLDA